MPEERNAAKKYYLGTAVKITVILSVDTAATCKITVDDPSETVKVNAADMIKEANKVYSYVYQSASTDDDGDYIFTITITYGGYTSVTQNNFTLIEQE